MILNIPGLLSFRIHYVEYHQVSFVPSLGFITEQEDSVISDKIPTMGVRIHINNLYFY